MMADDGSIGPGPGSMSTVTELTALIVASAVRNDAARYQASDLPYMIRAVRAALAEDHGGVAGASLAAPDKAPMMSKAQWGKLITPGGIKSLLDGSTYKTLKRHLAKGNHDPKSYRAAYGLPADFPMVAPDYSATRSAMAKSVGFGGGRNKAVTAEAGPPAKTSRPRKPKA